VKPAPFKYIEAEDEAALSAVLAQYGDEARLLAGGQSLVPMMNFRIVQPSILIDINRINALDYIASDGKTLHIGALTRHATIEDSKQIGDDCQLLAQAVCYVAHRAVRNRGTLGGTVALAYPGAEMPLALMTLDAELELRSARGSRNLKLTDFIRGALDTALGDDEYIRGFVLELPPKDSRTSFREASRRHGDFAIAAAAAVCSRKIDGTIDYLRLGISGGTGAPLRLASSEKIVIDNDDAAAITDVCRGAVEDIEVFGDHHYPEDYRRHVLGGVLERALRDVVITSDTSHVH
jgi:CO/xanthine dehydrogenase FAD-binding subunit